MNDFLKKPSIVCSLIITIFLLILNSCPVFAGETILNSAISVSVPERQSGNPGDFLTYVLIFQNRSLVPVDLEVKYLTEPEWDVIGDDFLTIPANTSNFFFPITIMIPHNASANITKNIELRFKLLGEPFSLPPVYVPILVNPVSAINFSVPSPQNGTYGSSVSYNVLVSNGGNTIEKFSVKGASENNWQLTIDPINFELNPGESQSVLVKHQIPGYTENEYDQIKLEFSWGNQQKIVLLTTSVTDQFAKMAERYYIWQGQVSASHPNLTEPSVADPNLSFSLNGQWKPDSSCQFYFSDLLNDTNRRYFTHLKTDSWDIKTGDFSLAWQGLIAPKTSLGNLRVARNLDGRSYAIYAWEPTEEYYNERPLGFEMALNKNSKFSLLNESGANSDQTVLEWDYQTNLEAGLKWSNSVAYNASGSNSYGLRARFESNRGNWNLNTNLQVLNQISAYLEKKRFNFTLYQPLSDKSLTMHTQFIYETRTLEDSEPTEPLTINSYDDYNLETLFHWPSGLNLRLSHQYQLCNGAFSKDNTSFFLEDSFEIDRYQNEWWFSHSFDHSTEDDSDYSKFNWNTRYALTKEQGLIFNPQIVSNSSATDNESKIGFGYQQQRYHGSLGWKALYYQFLSSTPKQSLEFSLNWRIFQYQLLFDYTSNWDNHDYTTETCSLTFRKKFSVPIIKPLGTIEGTAFIDRNQNGSFDSDELPLRKTILILDGTTTFETDEKGNYTLSGLSPGEHQITLDPFYEVIYLPKTPVTIVSVKQYQSVRLDLPFIRSQNITGIIYFDKNRNGIQETQEPVLAGIPVILKNLEQKEISCTYTNYDGRFTFYQLAPDSYRITFDENLLPDNMQPPPNNNIFFDSNRLEESVPLKIGLTPFERPINIIKESAMLLLLDKELVKAGETLSIKVESTLSLNSLELILPTGENVRLEISGQKALTYQWQLPADIPTGQAVIKCHGIDTEGQSYQEEALLFIISE